MKKNVLITGGSGTVGNSVIKLLLKTKDYHVTCFDLYSKKSASFYRSFKTNITIIYGDIRNAELVSQVIQHQDIVIHLAAIIPPAADQFPDLTYQVNVLGTQNLIDAISCSSRRPFLLYASSVSVYGDRLKNPFISATDILKPSEWDEYGNTKVEVEKRIQNSSIDWTIFRLTAIMGARNHKIGPLMFHMSLDTPMEIATPEDTARAFVQAIEQTKELNHHIYNLSGGERCRIIYRDFLRRSFQLSGLGDLDFPDKTFAEKNFHCAYFLDGDDLENLLHFRHDTIETFFEQFKAGVSPIQKMVTKLFRKWIKRRLLRKSEPYRAYRLRNEIEMIHYFE